MHPYTAADNCAYSDWSEGRFRNMLLTYSTSAPQLKWVVCPDKVGDWRATLGRFQEWGPRIRGLGFPLALALQDGQSAGEVPWNDLAAVFLGGTTDFKMSDEALTLCWIAKDRGKMVHIGRVNSITRLERFAKVADSFDGLSYSFYSRTYLLGVIRWLESL